MPDYFTPDLRSLVSVGELWTPGHPVNNYQGWIDSSRVLTQINSPTITTGKLGDAYNLNNPTFANQALQSFDLPFPTAGVFYFCGWFYRVAMSGTSNTALALGFLRNWGSNYPSGYFITRLQGASLNQIGFFVCLSGVLRPVTFTVSVPLNAWTHIGCGFDVTNSTCYCDINGVRQTAVVSALTFPDPPTASPPTFRISNDSTPRWHGLVEQLMLFESIPSTDAIAAIYNSGAGRSFGVIRAMPPQFLISAGV